MAIDKEKTTYNSNCLCCCRIGSGSGIRGILHACGVIRVIFPSKRGLAGPKMYSALLMLSTVMGELLMSCLLM